MTNDAVPLGESDAMVWNQPPVRMSRTPTMPPRSRTPRIASGWTPVRTTICWLYNVDNPGFVTLTTVWFTGPSGSVASDAPFGTSCVMLTIIEGRVGVVVVVCAARGNVRPVPARRAKTPLTNATITDARARRRNRRCRRRWSSKRVTGKLPFDAGRARRRLLRRQHQQYPRSNLTSVPLMLGQREPVISSASTIV